MQQPADTPPFSPAGWRGPAGAPSPISSRPPAPAPAPAHQQQQQQQQQMEEQHGGTAVSGSGSGSVDGGEEGERSSAAGGNRWPRQETLALLKIRSEMDAAFREAALKGPLWEQVSRRLAEMGHTRSAKKCREKFENVDKYYRRTKDGRTGRGDGKTYRFFTELEALHGASAPHHPPPAHAAVAPAASTIGAYSAVPSAPSPRVLAPEPSPPPLLLTHQPVPVEAAACLTTTTATVGDASFSDDSDGEDTDETADGGKRKRRGGSWGHGGKAMRFFEGLMRQVMERQEAMQSRLLEAIERRDQDRMIREEAWRRQEVARLAREQDALAQERAVAASRDAAVVSFIQRITGQIVPVHAPPSSFPAKPAVASVKPPPLQPTPVASAAPAPAPPTPRPPVQAQPNVTTPMRTQPPTTTEPQPQTPQHQQSKEIVVHAPEQPPVDMAGGASPSRWPKAEVHALIQLRTEMETRYQDTAPKGPLWEDISVGMRRLGYNRSSKRCKEKWENINKYFKKVKESSRKRPEDSKTCPYFHQLDALYRTKALASSSGVHAPALAPAPAEAAPVTVLSPVPLSSQTPPPAAQHVEHGANNVITNGNGHGNGAAMQVKASNGAGAAGMFPSPVHAAGNGGNNNGTATNKLELKQEGIAKETPTVVQSAVAMNHHSSYGRNDRRDVYDLDSDSMDEDDEDDFDDDEDEEDEDAVGGGRNINMPPAQYDAHFLQRQHQQQQHNHNVVRPNAANGSGNPPAGNAAPTSAPATSGTPFLAMVQ
ncbi:hypothetical protein ACQJBY_034977 [Aegilops geniculata]